MAPLGSVPLLLSPTPTQTNAVAHQTDAGASTPVGTVWTDHVVPLTVAMIAPPPTATQVVVVTHETPVRSSVDRDGMVTSCQTAPPSVVRSSVGVTGVVMPSPEYPAAKQVVADVGGQDTS